MRKAIVLFIILCVSSVQLVYAETWPREDENSDFGTEVARNGETAITAKLKKMNIRVKISNQKLPADQKSKYTDDIAWYNPDRITNLIEIIVNDKPLFIPDSILSGGLIDINWARIDFVKKEAILTLFGGDAGESYFVKIKFDKNRIKRRGLWAGEFPDNIIEETIYYPPVDIE